MLGSGIKRRRSYCCSTDNFRITTRRASKTHFKATQEIIGFSEKVSQSPFRRKPRKLAIYDFPPTGGILNFLRSYESPLPPNPNRICHLQRTRLRWAIFGMKVNHHSILCFHTEGVLTASAELETVEGEAGRQLMMTTHQPSEQSKVPHWANHSFGRNLGRIIRWEG